MPIQVNIYHFLCSRIEFLLYICVFIYVDDERNPAGSLHWRHNKRDGVSKHQLRDCLLNRLFMRRSKKTPKLRVTGLYVGNSPEIGEFPAQMASNAKNVSIWWRHHDKVTAAR